MTALKRKNFSGVVNKEKDKGKDKTTTEDKWNRKGVYQSVLYVWGDTDGKSRQDTKLRKGKGCESGQSKGWRGCWEHHKSFG